MLRHR